MVIDHIGILVPCLERGIEQWEMLFGYRQSSDIIQNTRQRVRVVFLSKPNSLSVKLIEPSGPDSPVHRAALKGGGLHHLCFRCSALYEEIRGLKKQGVRLLVPPEPGEAFRGHPIAFMLARNNLHFELIDTLEKQGWDAEESAGYAHAGFKEAR
jgi:methylmalonyl-CoA/ethylmalonyl-CoA epimerase